MRKFFLLLIISLPFTTFAQKNYSNAEIQRLAELGKVWGMLHNFSPAMARGTIATDSLITDVAEALANDPSAETLKSGLSKMLAKLHDPLTHVMHDANTTVTIFTESDSIPSYYELEGDVIYIAYPTGFAVYDTAKKLPWMNLKNLARYKGIVLDLRNKNNENGDYAFTEKYGAEILNSIIDDQLRLPMSQFRYQAGFLDQKDQTVGNNVYSAGWYTTAADIFPSHKKETVIKSNICFVVNKFTGGELLAYIIALQSAGKCKIIFEGNAEDYTNGIAIDYVTDIDSVKLKIRVGDLLTKNGNIIGGPDLIMPEISDKKTFFDQCTRLTLNTTPDKKDVGAALYIHPYPTLHEKDMFVPVGLRLFGLYNYWNAIRYFNPNMHLIKQSWDSVLTEFIPRFINATDSATYYFTIRDLGSRIHDSHGFFGRLPAMPGVTAQFGFTVPLSIKSIDNRYYIVAKDTAQQLKDFWLWDEVTHIDGIPVNTYKQKFRTRFAASNEWTFERDVTGRILLSGAKNSIVQLSIQRKGRQIIIPATRSRSDFYPDYKTINFYNKHKDIEILPGNIGYVNMDILNTDRIDKLFDTLMHTKAIVFDIRNYPNGTAWSIVPRLAVHDSVAVKFGKPYVTYESIYLQPQVTVKTDYFIVDADKTKPPYKGKIIMLCNAETQSQAEYTIMMFQGAAGKRVTVIGSPTAGADGNVTSITLPGGFQTYFSGMEVLYPDGKLTQQCGIRIDIPAKPTPAGLQAGKDEVLERAITFIETGK
ncbi:hypothetical protein I5907_07850 [Panacibacter sp. DH6]|uniref:Tail specific protease domain-containing protein n=1 Tax=Panacibacter microcysteis TaxID=2793269 RepID=A0A931E308_9BACT|nr:S41 family peptidase [Panacibacter microcysteis]MBG9376143.1 hypothetical protein [Panacibacter microcysteis]